MKIEEILEIYKDLSDIDKEIFKDLLEDFVYIQKWINWEIRILKDINFYKNKKILQELANKAFMEIKMNTKIPKNPRDLMSLFLKRVFNVKSMWSYNVIPFFLYKDNLIRFNYNWYSKDFIYKKRVDMYDFFVDNWLVIEPVEEYKIKNLKDEKPDDFRKEKIDTINKYWEPFVEKEIMLMDNFDKVFKFFLYKENEILKIIETIWDYENNPLKLDWKVIFNKSKLNVKYRNWEIFINDNIIKFRSKETKIYNIFKFAFESFKHYESNKVSLPNLEILYLKDIENYPHLSKNDFKEVDKTLRKSIKTKNKSIGIDDFIGISKSWIECQYYIPESE